MTSRVSGYGETIERYDATVLTIYEAIWIHRYRDASVDVRVESITALGGWMESQPHVFIADEFLKYLGWTLNDKTSECRRVTVTTLLMLYRHENEAAFSEKMDMFTTRFTTRFITLTQDEDVTVATSAIQLLITLDKY